MQKGRFWKEGAGGKKLPAQEKIVSGQDFFPEGKEQGLLDGLPHLPLGVESPQDRLPHWLPARKSRLMG